MTCSLDCQPDRRTVPQPVPPHRSTEAAAWRDAAVTRSLVVVLLAAVVAGPATRVAAAPPSSTAPARNAIPSSTPTDATALLTALASMPGLEASFVEEKHLRLLAAPLVSRGKIYFARPGFLARRVEAPRPSTVIITPDSLRYRDAGGDGRIDLRSRPDVQSFVESFVRVLAGDQASLEQTYALSFTAASTQQPKWRFELRPKAATLAELITRLEIRGTGLSVDEIYVYEKSGDWSVTRIENADPARTFTPAEHDQLFGLTSP